MTSGSAEAITDEDLARVTLAAAAFALGCLCDPALHPGNHAKLIASIQRVGAHVGLTIDASESRN